MTMVKWKWNRIALHSTTIYYLYDRCCIVDDDVETTGDNDIWIQIKNSLLNLVWVPSHTSLFLFLADVSRQNTSPHFYR